eukprot:scaffold69116_cov32-Tisochrysis_lutea.AAC.1
MYAASEAEISRYHALCYAARVVNCARRNIWTFARSNYFYSSIYGACRDRSHRPGHSRHYQYAAHCGW